jgi:hypothetical protein
VKTYRILILFGLILYVVSFFLTGVKDASAAANVKGIYGYDCASITLLSPWGSDGLKMFREEPVNFLSVLFSGWINPVFLITVVVLLIRPNSGAAGVLRIVLLIMFIAPWIVFYREHLHPRGGYFLWTAAMLLVMFSSRLDKNAV